jgi:hypothetical protein
MYILWRKNPSPIQTLCYSHPQMTSLPASCPRRLTLPNLQSLTALVCSLGLQPWFAAFSALDIYIDFYVCIFFCFVYLYVYIDFYVCSVFCFGYLYRLLCLQRFLLWISICIDFYVCSIFCFGYLYRLPCLQRFLGPVLRHTWAPRHVRPQQRGQGISWLCKPLFDYSIVNHHFIFSQCFAPNLRADACSCYM